MRKCSLFLIAAPLVTVASSAHAVLYSFQPVAEVVPHGGVVQYIYGAPAINSSGAITFGGRYNGVNGTYVASGGGIQLVGNAVDVSPDINDAGAVAFFGVNGGAEAILRVTGSSTTVIKTAPANSSFSPLLVGTAHPSISGNGSVGYYFYTSGATPPATIEIRREGLGTQLLSKGYNLTDHFSVWPKFNDAGGFVYAVTAQQGGSKRVFEGTGGSIVDIGIGTNPTVSDSGDLAYVATDQPNSPIRWRQNGVFTTLQRPAGTTSICLTLTDSGLFAASGETGSPDGATFMSTRISWWNESLSNWETIIQSGEPFAGSTILSLGFLRESANDAGQLAFYARLAKDQVSDRVMVVRADPVPEPAVPVALTAGILAMKRRRPGNRVGRSS